MFENTATELSYATNFIYGYILKFLLLIQRLLFILKICNNEEIRTLI